MNRKYFAVLLIMVLPLTSLSQSLCGYVTDKNTGERLPGVNFREVATNRVTTSDANGFYCISFSRNSAWIASMVGYTSDTLMSPGGDHATFHLELMPSVVELPEIEVVQAHRERNFKEGKHTFSPVTLARVPSLGGERDILKTITILPGITGGNEGFSTFSVRGGGTDQNLFVLDGAHIYNTGHLFNFFSIFNPDALKSVNVYKNYFPPRYGGRLSSVTEVQFRDGNNKETEFKIDLGIINSKLTLEGPIGTNEKTSYLLAVRSSYLDLFKAGRLRKIKNAKPTIETRPVDNLDEFGYTFSDLNFKVNHNFDKNNRLFLSLYGGADFYRLYQLWHNSNDQLEFTRFNTLASLKSYHLVGSKLFLEFIASYSRQSNEIEEKNDFYWREAIFDPESMIWKHYPHLVSTTQLFEKSALYDFTLQGHATYSLGGESMLKSGISMIRHNYHPGRYVNIFADTLATIKKELEEPALKATEMAIYAGIETEVFNRLSTMAGVRVSMFQSGEAFFLNPEPRLSVSYSGERTGMFSASLTMMSQYNHALSKNEQLMRNTIWVPSTKMFRPQKALQYSLGYLKNFRNNAFTLSTHVYYKTMKDLVHFLPHNEEDFLAFNWDEKLLGGGRGSGYGLELMVEKNLGTFTGNINYTYSRHLRQFEGINQAKWFPYKYNREHVLNIVTSVKLSQSWRFGALWTISDGLRISFPNGFVNDNPFGFNYYTYPGINNAKLPVYHRLDFSFDYTRKMRGNRELGVSFNVYNAYYRKNSYYIFIESDVTMDRDGNILDERKNVKSVSFIPIIPMINVSYKW